MQPAAARAWDGAHGLEWTVPSPAPYHTFEIPPPLPAYEATVVYDEADEVVTGNRG